MPADIQNSAEIYGDISQLAMASMRLGFPFGS
ncbi:predicted protein [Sclerotinia sclerotiorum 1980 UF-70]|uniref:Uncharacterized protein n=1 Tax=Sclerotinia sclerotiorum (strain ATCC 18683 / 1980 / Ss-1) TaxID=665079 RepID=A7E4F5_SCLS1|nr:predicted protein [Sclerotinia sclerotiorum 1980 UF-70]EDN90777.1 predicted protein [Sclerotinia sclerotiorum 1980 UF-70]